MNRCNAILLARQNVHAGCSVKELIQLWRMTTRFAIMLVMGIGFLPLSATFRL